MKTSNKLLIAFASALILIPLLGMIYVSQVKYRDGKSGVESRPEITSFDSAAERMTSIAVNAFQTINIADAKGVSLNVHIIKDAKFGVKFANRHKDKLSATVDSNGQLQLIVKNLTADESTTYYINVYVFAPAARSLNVAHANGLHVSANLDSLNIEVSDGGRIYFGEDLKANKINLVANQIADVNAEGGQIKTLNMILNKSNFRSQEASFTNLSITSYDNADISLGDGYSENKSHTISSLVINTNGKADVKVDNLTILNCSGKFSDQTQVKMPAVNLNQMYQIKK